MQQASGSSGRQRSQSPPVAGEWGGDVADAIETAFTAGKSRLPHGIRSIESPLSGIEAAHHLQAAVAKWAAGNAPTPRTFEVLGTYRLLG